MAISSFSPYNRIPLKVYYILVEILNGFRKNWRYKISLIVLCKFYTNNNSDIFIAIILYDSEVIRLKRPPPFIHFFYSTPFLRYKYPRQTLHSPNSFLTQFVRKTF